MFRKFMKKIAWAVDPFEPVSMLHRNAVKTLRFFRDKFDATIEPVFVLKMQPQSSPFVTACWVPEYHRIAKNAFQEFFLKLKIKDFSEPKIILHESLSLKAAIDALCDYAVHSDTNLIVTNTHSRVRLQRLFLGSFAETLLYRSKVPVMVIGDEIKRYKSTDTVLFPTDFSIRSQRVFREVLKLAIQLDWKIIVVHCVPPPIDPAMLSTLSSLGGAWQAVPGQILKETEIAERTARHWKTLAIQRGVELDFLISSLGGSIWETVIRLAKREKVGLILLESQSGPLSSMIIGSVARQVIRHAPCPVMTLRVVRKTKTLYRPEARGKAA